MKQAYRNLIVQKQKKTLQIDFYGVQTKKRVIKLALEFHRISNTTSPETPTSFRRILRMLKSGDESNQLDLAVFNKSLKINSLALLSTIRSSSLLAKN